MRTEVRRAPTRRRVLIVAVDTILTVDALFAVTTITTLATVTTSVFTDERRFIASEPPVAT